MFDSDWKLLTTLPDLPTARSLAAVLTAAGMEARVASDAGVLGQATPSRIYVESERLEQARAFLAATPAEEPG